jgi:hypothetical protein
MPPFDTTVFWAGPPLWLRIRRFAGSSRSRPSAAASTACVGPRSSSPEAPEVSSTRLPAAKTTLPSRPTFTVTWPPKTSRPRKRWFRLTWVTPLAELR